MAKATPKLADFSYTLLADRETPEPRTTFTLRPLTGTQRLQAVELSQKGQFALSIDLVVRFGLRGWKNFSDDAGEVMFLPGAMDANLERLSGEQLMELAGAIKDASVLSEQEKKT